VKATERVRIEPTHAEMIAALVRNAPPLPDEARERVRAVIRRAAA
jgi:hypothetical protein